jgi:competence protein ComEC
LAWLIGVRVHDTVFLQQTSGASKFTRDAWLQYWAAGMSRIMPIDGMAADDAVACHKDACLLRPLIGAKAALLVRGALHPEGCGEASIIVSAEPARGLCPRPWPALVDRFTVWRYGATAIWLDQRHARVVTDREWRGTRPWVPPPPVPRTPAASTLPPTRSETPAQAETPAVEE